MPSLVVTGPQIKEKQRAAQCVPPAYIVPKDPSLNRVKMSASISIFKKVYQVYQYL